MTDTDLALPLLDAGSVTTPCGWRAAAVACGMRYSGRTDLALLVSDAPATAAALFTTNAVQSAHIHYDRAVLARNATAIRALAVNSGSANACTGQAGIDAAATVARTVEEALALPAHSALVMSTGIIGLPLAVGKIVDGIAQAMSQLAVDQGPAAASAIMTTDTRPKYCAVCVPLPDGGEVHIGGMAKGSGMIHPNMATMLGMVTTDATVPPAILATMLRDAADQSFHCISVDGDISTNDTLLALANGQAGQPPIDSRTSPAGQALLAGLTTVCQYLAKEVVRDGEGATRLVTIHVRGAATDAEARQAAMVVARSPLVKTALFAADPNWGRIVCALGYSQVALDPGRLVLSLEGVTVFANGMPVAFDEQTVHRLLDAPTVQVEADLGMGRGTGFAWTCDLSYEYVRINAEYRT